MATQNQSTRSGPAAAGYACEFVEQSPASNLFICEICRLVLRQPNITQCCGKNACRPCIAEKAGREPCPIPGCKNQHTCVKIIFNRDLHCDVQRRRVYCSLRESGCQWADALENLDRHLLDCPFLEVECQNSCGMMIQRRMIEEHEAVCERYPVRCDQCRHLYERRDKSDHIDACSLTKVMCSFSIVGCTAELLNKDLQQHFEESLSDHYALVTKQSQEIQAEIGEKREFAQSKENIKPLLALEMQVASLNDAAASTEREMTELQRALEEARLEFLEVNERYRQVKDELQRLVNEKEAFTVGVREECDLLEYMVKERVYGPALPYIHPADILSRPPDSPVTTEEYVPQVTFMIPRFAEERKNDACLCLPPFYSHRGGYKMCLMVYCNGLSWVTGEFVSISLRNLSGKYDRKLTWPLRCKVEIGIESARKGEPDLKRTIGVLSQSPVPEDRYISPKQELNCCARAIPHWQATSCLMTGCLTIKVIGVKI